MLRSKHDHVLAGHLGQSKTLYLVRKDYYWPKLHEFVIDYVRSCNACMRNKAKRHHPYGLLKQLPIPPQPWDSISMDFIEQLPQSEGFTEILVIVDRLTKQIVLIPTRRSINVVRPTCVFETRSSLPCDVRQRFRICLKILQITSSFITDEPTLYFWLPP